ncbi:MAG: LysM peptidoglycan-binding domain-containing protein [Rikenellaceae bacterium]|nr:LysM peptidoglycan-binding domain-containing protein [Rikenellaceae bacterium]
MKKYFLIFIFLIICLGVCSQSINVRSDNRVIVAGEQFYVHHVRKGETLFSLSRTYGVDRNEIIKYNPTAAEGLQEGAVIKVPVSEQSIESEQKNILGRVNNRRTTRHLVNKGETAYSISKRYAVTIDDIITANPGFDPLNILVGQEILIPKSIIGSVTQTEIKDNLEQYTDALSDVLPGFEIYLVETGETLYSISKEKNIDIDTIKHYNQDQLKDGLKFGSLIKLPIGVEPGGNIPEVSVTDEDRTTGRENRPSVLFPNYNDTNLEENTENLTGNYISGAVNMAVLLPFTPNGGENFTDFYNGILIALKELKSEGVSVNLNLYYTKRSPEEVGRILSQGGLSRADLIVGPVYDNTFAVAAEFAEENGIPVISPLGAVNSGNRYVYQIAPVAEGKYAKLTQMFAEGNNVIFISSSNSADQKFMVELRSIVPAEYTTVEYIKGKPASAYGNVLSQDRKNVIIIPSENESVVDEILTKLSSIQNSVSSRSGRYYDISIVGSNRWTRFNNIDKQLFFKLGVTFVTTYHADRNDSRVRNFESLYLTEFGKFPSQYSYRGYDIAKLFIPAVKNYGRNYADYLRRTDRKILQVPYSFRQDSSGKWVNDEWVVVKYNNDFTVDVY